MCIRDSTVFHKGHCEIGKQNEAKRQDYWQRVGALSPEGREEEYTMTDKRFKGHEEILIATGYHNPKDPGDWCYLIQCKCGAKDIAWNHEDARQAAADHRVDVRTPAPTRPDKAPRAASPVPGTAKPARQRTAQPSKPPRKVLY